MISFVTSCTGTKISSTSNSTISTNKIAEETTILESTTKIITATETILESTTTTLESEIVKCIKITDGDTIVIEDSAGKQYKVRYIGMDTPEQGDPYYEEATEANKNLVLDKEIRMVKDVSGTDKYGRLLRYIYVGDMFVNAYLLSEGFAQILTIPPDVKYADEFLKLQQEARENNKGLWGIEETTITAEQTTTTVAETTTSISEETTTTKPDNEYFVGSKNSDVYHYPDCVSAKKIKPENLIIFNSVEEAKAAGYRPCKNCNPPG
ncbi:MAG: thermonuclease family protein [Candidatus Humimicrobiaceae bacterium]